MVSIRNATPRDLQRIFEIERLAFPHPWSLESFRRELALPFSRLITAEADQQNADAENEGNLAGFLCRWLIAEECHILNVAVHPEMRRMGIAAQLMAEAIAESKAKKIELVTLEVRRSNFAARNLYRKFNFEDRRLRRNYYGLGEDAIVMELTLETDLTNHK
ncbi:MAG: ribosomal protein S18-alanine N-acetyltransferase [Candidatus Binataceae bacterium]|nr:ribosomal protein S18-alanine N-acetyltransferase [Candidatus Binataceae bacterium]